MDKKQVIMVIGCQKFIIYLAWGEKKYILSYSHNPLLDYWFLVEKGFTGMLLLTKPLPIGYVSYLFNNCTTELERVGTLFKGRSIEEIVALKVRKLRKHFARLGLSKDFLTENYLQNPIPKPFFDLGKIKVLEEKLMGRILFLNEIDQFIKKKGINAGENEIQDILQILFLERKCQRLPSICFEKDGRKICHRCGQRERILSIVCASCGLKCYHCEECIALGESRSCQPLYGVPGGRRAYKLPHTSITPVMDVQLSLAQKEASAALRQFVLQPEQREKLVWAACGAGKTEVTFQAAAEVLSRGGRVLFAMPRRTPLPDIFNRLKRAFPQVPVKMIHGETKDKFSHGEIIAATTHQVLRFYSAFDLIILDEVDAYPYKDSSMLQFAVRRARRKAGKIIYLTATPSGEIYERWRKRELSCIKIPARHHGYPLPEPKIVVEKKLRRASKGFNIPEIVVDLIHETLEGDLSQLLIFVPSVFLAIHVAEELNRITQLPPFNNFNGRWVEYSHGRDEDRELKRERFIKGEFPVLVTTTLWERGITVPRVNVLVLFADAEEIFDEAALIQMAGRAGRTSSYPMGKVWFVGSRVTKSMKSARGKIHQLNIEASEKGFLKPEGLQWLNGWEDKVNCLKNG
ncbi:MAG: DEAD/DEAH box helicase family protein [Clostridia bacterium]|nr:DEAD/DEAH box helicase family protein [Clostridia bacterium]